MAAESVLFLEREGFDVFVPAPASAAAYEAPQLDVSPFSFSPTIYLRARSPSIAERWYGSGLWRPRSRGRPGWVPRRPRGLPGRPPWGPRQGRRRRRLSKQAAAHVLSWRPPQDRGDATHEAAGPKRWPQPGWTAHPRANRHSSAAQLPNHQLMVPQRESGGCRCEFVSCSVLVGRRKNRTLFTCILWRMYKFLHLFEFHETVMITVTFIGLSLSFCKCYNVWASADGGFPWSTEWRHNWCITNMCKTVCRQHQTFRASQLSRSNIYLHSRAYSS